LTESLWYDELWSTKERLGGVIPFLATILWDPHPPLYSFLMTLWIQLFGDGEISIRLPALISGLATIALTFFLAKFLFSTRVGLGAALLLALSPTHIWYSQEARSYSLIMAVTLLAVYSLFRGRPEGPKGPLVLVYGLCAVSMAFMHYYAVVMLAVITGYCLARQTDFTRRIFRINVLVLWALALYLALKLAFGEILTGQDYMRQLDLLEFWGLLFNWFPSGNTIWMVPWDEGVGVFSAHPFMALCQLFLAMLFFSGVYGAIRTEERSRQDSAILLIALLFCVPVLLLLLGSFGLDQTYVERSLLLIMPFFFILLAHGVFLLRHRGPRYLMSFLVLLFVGFSLSKHYAETDRGTVSKQNPDWRAATSYLSEELDKADGSALILSTAQLDVLPYYDARLSGDGPVTVLDFVSIEQIPRDLPGRQVYLVHNRYWDNEFGVLRDQLLLRRGYTVEETHRVRGVDILKLRRPGNNLNGSASY
jgi:uncharacterized membrane protein